MHPLRARLRQLVDLLFPERTLDAETLAALDADDQRLTRDRILTWAPVLVVFEVFASWMTSRAHAVTAAEVLWRRNLTLLDGGQALVYGAIILCVRFPYGVLRPVARYAGPLINFSALLATALIGINAQRVTGTIGPFLGVILGSPYVIRARTHWFFLSAVSTGALLLVGVLVVQQTETTRIAHCLSIGAFVPMALVYSGFYRRSLVTERHLRRELLTFNAQLESRVEAQTQELQRFALRLDDVLETERRRLARDLHDDLGQELTALRFEVEAMRASVTEPRHRRALDRMSVAIERSHEEVRAILESLRPRVLDEEGLEAAVRWLSLNLRERTGCVCSLDVAIDEEPEGRVGLVAFRVAQEALTNVARHAGASQVALSLKETSGALVLEVTDNGTRRAKAVEPGRGMTGMQERVVSIGGELRVSELAPHGTRVWARLPLHGDGRVVAEA